MKQKIKITIPEQTVEVEIEVDGTTPPVTPPVEPPVSTGFKMGSNGFPWSPMSLYKNAGLDWVRCYFASGWAWRPNGLHIQSLWQAGTAEANGMDEYFEKAKAAGLNVLFTVHQTPEWFRNTGRTDGNNDYAPISAGAKRDDPKSYKEYASFLFQIAARYGSVKHPDSILKTDPESRWNGDLTEKKSGLNTLKYIECWNEPDKWWSKGTEAYFTPEATAALMSACYDGHENTLGECVGIKNADPSMIVVMPGLTDFDLPYLQALDAWFKANRKDKKWPCDIGNIHHYSNIGNKPKQHPAQWKKDGGCYPSEDQNFDTVKEVVAFFENLGLKLWVTEGGYDTIGPSNMQIIGKNGKSNEQAQAEALVETATKYKAYGVDAFFLFNIHDDIGAADGGQFENCGIYSTKATGFRPKAAVAAIKAFITTTTLSYQEPEIKARSFKQPMKK